MDAQCKLCGKTKQVTDFRRHYKDGPYEPWNLRSCKECTHGEYVQRYSNKRSRDALHAASSNWKKANPERHAQLNQEYRKRFPEKIIAQNRLGYAVRSGKLKRLPCEVCGVTKRVHGHHASYKPEDWYNVRWLCFKCHKMEHAPPEYLNKT